MKAISNNGKQGKIGILKSINKYKVQIFCVLPAILIITIFKYYPFVTSVYQSFFNWNGANVKIFEGLGNYKDLLKDKMFHDAIFNILKVCVATILINLTFPFIAAELVSNIKNQKIQKFFKLGFIIPMVVPFMVVILLWKWILAGDYGIFNMLLQGIGLGGFTKPWLGTESTSLGAIIFINFPWIAGLPFLLYLAGRQNISEALYEAASLEGAGTFQKIIHIDIPLLSSHRKLVITYMLIQAFQMFDQPSVLTGGGPGTATLTPALYIYQRAFNYNQFGYSSSIGVALFILVMVITFLNQRIMKESDVMD
ncbi:MAG TPA: sugar ABC transporter permease [Clostridiales bacterium]|nr:sugar ABC transporter permease [Clostridiales bacterium]